MILGTEKMAERECIFKTVKNKSKNSEIREKKIV